MRSEMLVKPQARGALTLRGGDQQRAEMHPHGDSVGAWQAKVCAFRLCRGRKKHLKA